MNSQNGEQFERALNPTQEAVAMTAWFPDYLFGATDEIGALPENTKKRLYRHFNDDLKAGLRMICDEIPMLPADVQPDIAAYICGFPEDDLEVLLETDVRTIVETLDAAFPPIQPPKIAKPATSVPAVQPQAINKAPSVPEGSVSGAEEGVHWGFAAVCAQTDPEAFFPEKGGSTRDAKRICRTCDARQECLVYALKRDERFGIWGGFSERERRKMTAQNKRFDNVLSLEEIAEQAIETNTQEVLREVQKKAAQLALKEAV